MLVIAPFGGDLQIVDRVSSGSEKLQTAAFGAKHVLFFFDEFINSGAFAVEFTGFLFRIDYTELLFGIVFAEIVQFTGVHLVGYIVNNIFSGAFHAQKFIELVAHDHIFALDISTDMAVFPIPEYFDVVQSGPGAVDLFDLLDLGAAGEVFAVPLFDVLKIADGVFHQMFQVVADFFQAVKDRPDLLLVLFNIKAGNTPHRQSQELIDIFVGNIPQKLIPERRQTFLNFLIFLILRTALFDAFVNAVFKEELCQSFSVFGFQQPAFFDLKLPLQVIQKFAYIAFQHIRYTHLHRAAVANHRHLGRDTDRAIRIHKEPFPGLFRVIPTHGGNADLHLVSSVIHQTAGGNTDLVFFGSPLNGCHQRSGVGSSGDLPDHQFSAFNIYSGTQSYLAVAVVVFSYIHHPALLKVGEYLKLFAPQMGDLGINKLVEVMGQYKRTHTHGNTVGAQHQQAGHLRRQLGGFFFAAVVVGYEIGYVVVEHSFIRQFAQGTLGVTRRSGRRTGKDITEVTFFMDKVRCIHMPEPFSAVAVHFHTLNAAAFVGKYHDGVANGSIAVRVIVHGVAHDIGGFGGAAVIVILIKGPQNSPLYGFQTIIHIRYGTGTYDITCVIQKVPIHHLAEKLVAAPFTHHTYSIIGITVGRSFHILQCRIFQIIFFGHGQIFLVTHSPLPPDCS